MKAFVTGGNGLLGRRVVRALAQAGARVWAPGRAELDLLSPGGLTALIPFRPDVVVNCAALTNVDACETDPDTAYRLNAELPARIAQFIDPAAYYVHVSTDYVFEGTKGAPYAEDDPAWPVCRYGETKLAGEWPLAERPNTLVLRTAWLYGAGAKGFYSFAAAAARKNEPVRAVADQRGSPTWAGDLAPIIARCVALRPVGVLHAAGAGDAHWIDFARAIYLAYDRDPALVTPISTAELKRPARRPADTRLDCRRIEAALGALMRPWRESLRDAVFEAPP